MQSLIQLVPRLPPAIDGVGDYALSLAQQLRREFGLQTQFVVGDPTWSGSPTIDGFTVAQVRCPTATALGEVLSRDDHRQLPMVLHYVGYGYAKRGCPAWLVDGLSRGRSHIPRLLTMFHEIYASGYPFWTSSFWLSSWQKQLAQQLVQMSDRLITSKERYAQQLREFDPSHSAEIITLPVFSTVGEPAVVTPLSDRPRHLVIFGSLSRKMQAYQQGFTTLQAVCQQLAIDTILDIGVPPDRPFATVGNVPIVFQGKQPMEQVSAILNQSLAGFVDYPAESLAKSTIFAAYCAHGLLPINRQSSLHSGDGLVAQQQYWVPDVLDAGVKNMEAMQAIADQAYQWYHRHSLPAQARAFARLLVE